MGRPVRWWVPLQSQETAIHPDFDSEQAYISRAHGLLEASRDAVTRLHDMVEVGAGGTHQARFEADVIADTVTNRLRQLEIGDRSLVFGRIDLNGDEGGGTFYIGRVAVWDDGQEPVTVDWRAPIAEPFYRATGRQPMGLARRRHFATRGSELLGVEDEYFGEAALGIDIGDNGLEVAGEGTLIATMESAHTGRLSDIVGTIQAEQDEIIRAPMPGVLVVQGGPGTGKTVVALHRAAYLLYTYRFPLEGQGVLVIGPNRLFLTYIEQVLPSLGEAGVDVAVLGDLVPGVRVRGADADAVAKVKGDLDMAKVLRRAVRDRQRPLRDDLVVGYGLQRLRLTRAETERIISEARRRHRRHNSAREFVEAEVFAALAQSGRAADAPEVVRERLRHTIELREALEWMWPVLSPAHLLHDLFGSKALLASAGADEVLYRGRSETVDDVVWTGDDAPLLDEARAILGARPGKRDEETVRTYGHIVVDEAQDLSPMQLRMLRRRSLNGSMTVVGDIAQATGAWAHDDWSDVADHLPDKRQPRRAELTIGYRLPEPTMEVASKVLAAAAPDLTPPRAVRRQGDAPRFVRGGIDLLAAVVRQELEAVGAGNVAVITPDSMAEEVSEMLAASGVEHGRAYEGALEMQVTVVPVRLVKGLELDAAVVVEPAAIVAEEAQGLRALYVALTRATRRLAIVYDEELPLALR